MARESITIGQKRRGNRVFACRPSGCTKVTVGVFSPFDESWLSDLTPLQARRYGQAILDMAASAAEHDSDRSPDA